MLFVVDHALVSDLVSGVFTMIQVTWIIFFFQYDKNNPGLVTQVPYSNSAIFSNYFRPFIIFSIFILD